MANTYPNPPDFTRIRNGDGTITSFCNRCPLTIARTFDSRNLEALESRHVCQKAERRRVVRLVHRIYDPTASVGDRLPKMHNEIPEATGPRLSQSAKLELIRAHLFLRPCHACAKAAENLSPNDERVCFRCRLSLKDRWSELAVVTPPLVEGGKACCSHKVQFYSSDEVFLDAFTRFITTGLKAGNAVIVAATESHRESLLQRLRERGLDVAAAAAQGRYIPLDAGGTLATFMVDGSPDPVRFLEVASALVVAAARAAKGEHPRVAACGECAPLLWRKGKTDAALRLEQLWDEIARTYDVDILCGYPGSSLQGEQSTSSFQRISEVHSAVYAR